MVNKDTCIQCGRRITSLQ